MVMLINMSVMMELVKMVVVVKLTRKGERAS